MTEKPHQDSSKDTGGAELVNTPPQAVSLHWAQWRSSCGPSAAEWSGMSVRANSHERFISE